VGLGLGLLGFGAEARRAVLGPGCRSSVGLYPAGAGCRSGNLHLALRIAVPLLCEGKGAIKGRVCCQQESKHFEAKASIEGKKD